MIASHHRLLLSVWIGALAALAAALCWTVASSIWRRLPTSLSGAQLNLLKNLLALALLLPWLAFSGGVVALQPLLLLACSGVLGIAAGDSLYFAALRRLGTRRTLTVDAGGPAVTALAGLIVLAEVPRPQQWLGLALISGALLLVALQQPPSGDAAASRQQGLGLLYAAGALICGSSGALVARLALRDGAIDPLQATAIRLAAAALLLLPLLRGLPLGWRRPFPARRRWPLGLLATLLGTTAGIALQQTALQRLPGALAVGLLATAPVLALPLAALEGDQPGWRGALAALLTLLGVWCVVA